MEDITFFFFFFGGGGDTHYLIHNIIFLSHKYLSFSIFKIETKPNLQITLCLIISKIMSVSKLHEKMDEMGTFYSKVEVPHFRLA